MLCQHGRRGACGTARTDRVLRCRESPCQGSTFCRIKGRPSGYHCRDDRKATFCRIGGHSGYQKQKRHCRDCENATFCRSEGHSGYQNQKKNCRDCLCSLYSCLGGIYTSCWIKGHSGYGKANTECRDCKGVALCGTAGHLGYQKAKIECRECQNFDLCRTAGHSGYHNHKKYCQDCHQSTIKNRQKEKLTMEKNHGRSGSFWTKGGSADTIVLTECVCVIL